MTRQESGWWDEFFPTDIEGYGTIKEEPISRDHRMMFILGVKPERSGHV